MNSTDCIIDPSFFNSVSQLSHFAWGAFTVMAVPAVLRSKWLTAWVWLLFEVFAGVKEGAWDPAREECDFSNFDWEDFLIYTVGTTVGFCIVWWSLPGRIHPLGPCNTPRKDWHKLETDCTDTN